MEKKNLKNWWYYHKWYVICGAVLLGILFDIIGNRFHLWEKVPDYQIAYVGETALTDDMVQTLTQAFQEVSGDYNKDGKVIVRINQYPRNSTLPVDERAYYEYASEVTLIGDITDCDSFFFLTDDPERLQKEHHILANPDGSCPDDADGSVDDKVLPLKLPGLSEELYLGIRCFYNQDSSPNREECFRLWTDFWQNHSI